MLARKQHLERVDLSRWMSVFSAQQERMRRLAVGGDSGFMAETAAVAISVPADEIVKEIESLGITHVINVPDTHQKSVLAVLARRTHPTLITACTEDEAIGINAGLYVGGKRPMLLIQNTGLLASINCIKGIAMDAGIPTFMLVGLFSRDVTRSPADDPKRVINRISPTLDTWDIPWYALERPDQIGVIAEAYQRSLDVHGPTVVLVGAPTS
jgi:sulfopyruvate decarboxylase TPP-binding subunit